MYLTLPPVSTSHDIRLSANRGNGPKMNFFFFFSLPWVRNSSLTANMMLDRKSGSKISTGHHFCPSDFLKMLQWSLWRHSRRILHIHFSSSLTRSCRYAYTGVFPLQHGKHTLIIHIGLVNWRSFPRGIFFFCIFKMRSSLDSRLLCRFALACYFFCSCFIQARKRT